MSVLYKEVALKVFKYTGCLITLGRGAPLLLNNLEFIINFHIIKKASTELERAIGSTGRVLDSERRRKFESCEWRQVFS